MNEQFRKPKGFGEILDHTFRLSKQHFSKLFLILLVMVGPVFLLEALIRLSSGVNLFRQTGSGEAWYDQILSSFEQTTAPGSVNLGADVGIVLIGLIATVFLYPVAEGAILYAIQHIRKDEAYTVGSVLKQAFSRFWPIVGSRLLFMLIVFGFILGPSIFIGLFGVLGSVANPVFGIVFSIILVLACAVVLGYLLTRWSFYFALTVLEHNGPGISRSWGLTSKRSWMLMGFYVVLYLITTLISLAVELSFGLFLGNSVLLMMIINLVTLVTTMIFFVGYAVVYFDFKVRREGDDLKEMIDEYEGNEFE
ncbi:hypothetical protein [Salinibacillus xinjiangensis]|uniref:Glycerophosphoryl diester phosphodiesterase membrane domain-containing protein n=1 Tax=Salinibacillus xinjiangensis TaxID=1229268 RepID=A0A6G1X996_9BACI|nr:hypothetical protein [Salinibacillus xinjiangensis]MRG87476.1 hypothetical protein [Salinibacillus xinjiangensis]